MAKEKKSIKSVTEQRPPIVVVMGHIDHGKTTLLDFIRKTKVTEGEAGGITQHVAAYEIKVSLDSARDKKVITFLDTPGHEAFSKIRSRGAKIADIAILVIAGDDKVNMQTEEAIEAIQLANIPFVIAINKIDKESANSEKIKKELSEKGIHLEGWGGKIPSVDISAKTGQGVDELLEMLALMSDLEELKTDISKDASGFVVESHLDKKRGIAATLVIQDGSLKQGMCIVSGEASAPVRIFEDFAGKPIKSAKASLPIVIVGFDKLPQAGAEFKSFKNKKDASCSIEQISETGSTTELESTKGKTVVPVIIKADVAGSVEALEKQFLKSQTENVVLNILRADVGDINEDDLKLASSGDKPIVLGFHIKFSQNMRLLAERLEVEVKLFDIIYEAEEWLTEEIKKREPKEEKEEVVGKIKILRIFRDEKSKKIIGGDVLSGKILLGKDVKIFRRDFFLGEGKITELQQQEDKKEEVLEGEQFGAMIQTKVNIAPSDRMEVIDRG